MSQSSSKAAKRERQRQNRQARLEYEAALEKRRKFWRSVRGFVLILVPIAAVFLFLALRSDGDSGNGSSDRTEPRRAADAPVKDPLPAPGAITIDPTKTYTATIETSEGTFSVALDAAAAPTSVNNFVYLARAGYYDGLDIFRVAESLFQTGSATNTAVGSPGYSVTAELPANGYQVGSVAWGKTPAAAPGTAGSQFFVITTAEYASQLPRDYGIIGRVTSGLEVLTRISGLAPPSGDGEPTRPVTMRRVTITES